MYLLHFLKVLLDARKFVRAFFPLLVPHIRVVPPSHRQRESSPLGRCCIFQTSPSLSSCDLKIYDYLGASVATADRALKRMSAIYFSFTVTKMPLGTMPWMLEIVCSLVVRNCVDDKYSESLIYLA